MTLFVSPRQTTQVLIPKEQLIRSFSDLGVKLVDTLHFPTTNFHGAHFLNEGNPRSVRAILMELAKGFGWFSNIKEFIHTGVLPHYPFPIFDQVEPQERKVSSRYMTSRERVQNPHQDEDLSKEKYPYILYFSQESYSHPWTNRHAPTYVGPASEFHAHTSLNQISIERSKNSVEQNVAVEFFEERFGHPIYWTRGRSALVDNQQCVQWLGSPQRELSGTELDFEKPVIISILDPDQ